MEIVNRLGQRASGRSRWVLGMLGLAAIVAVVLALGTAPAEGVHNEVACDDGDVPVGWECTELFNKGGSGNTVVGELFFKFDSSTGIITMATNLFGDLADTGLSGQKLCIDDDTVNWVSGESCLGGTAKNKINSASYTLAAPDEDGLAKYEYMLEGAALGTEGTVCFSGGVEVACTDGASGPFALYTVYIDGYEFLSFHFNQSLSIEAFFTTKPTIDCGDQITVADGAASALITRLENVDGSPCSPKFYEAFADDANNLIGFVPEGDQSGAYSATLTFGPEAGLDQDHLTLSYDAIDDGVDNFVEMLFCDGDPFSGSTLNPAVFETGHTACIVDETTTGDGNGNTVTTWDIVFLADPKFSGN